MDLGSVQVFTLYEEAKTSLFKAFMKQAKLRSTRHRLQRKLESINNKLQSNSAVDKVLNNPKYASLSVLKDRKFVEKLEADVEKEYSKKLRRMKKTNLIKKSGVEPQRLSKEEKKLAVVEMFQSHGMSAMKTSAISDYLVKKGLIQEKQNPIQWMRSIGEIPKKAVKPVSKARKDGSLFDPKLIPWVNIKG